MGGYAVPALVQLFLENIDCLIKWNFCLYYLLLAVSFPVTQQCAAILACFVVVLLDFKPRLVWQTVSGSDMHIFLIQNMDLSAKDSGAGNCIGSYSVKQGPRRIYQSLLESHWCAIPWLISISFTALSAWNNLFYKWNRKSRSFRHVMSFPGVKASAQTECPGLCVKSVFREDSLTNPLFASSLV